MANGLLELKGEDDMLDIIELPAQLNSAARRAGDSGILILHQELEDQIVNAGLVASGDFLDSIDLDVTAIEDHYSATIGSNLSYAQELESGRKPGNAPPVPAILEWMGSVGEEATLFGAMMIAQSIGDEGTVGHHIFEKAMEAGAEKVANEFESEMKLAVLS